MSDGDAQKLLTSNILSSTIHSRIGKTRWAEYPVMQGRQSAYSASNVYPLGADWLPQFAGVLGQADHGVHRTACAAA